MDQLSILLLDCPGGFLLRFLFLKFSYLNEFIENLFDCDFFWCFLLFTSYVLQCDKINNWKSLSRSISYYEEIEWLGIHYLVLSDLSLSLPEKMNTLVFLCFFIDTCQVDSSRKSANAIFLLWYFISYRFVQPKTFHVPLIIFICFELIRLEIHLQ